MLADDWLPVRSSLTRVLSGPGQTSVDTATFRAWDQPVRVAAPPAGDVATSAGGAAG